MPDPGVKIRQAPSGMRRAMESQVGGRIVSASYAGRDAAGNPIYNIKYDVADWGGAPKFARSTMAHRSAIVRRTVAWVDGKIGKPITQKSAFASEGRTSGGGTRNSMELQKLKDRYLKWLNGLPDSQISSGDRASLANQIDNYRGSPSQLTHFYNRLKANLPFGHVAEADSGGFEDDWLNDFLGGIGGGGGGGFAAPQYKAPDKRVVEDMAKGMMVSLLGGVADDRLDAAVSKYMTDHRRNWDSDSQEINPEQSLLEYIRAQPEYEQIHALRPEGADERSWISNRRSLAKRGGLNSEDLDDFAITQASVGGDEGDMLDAAAAAQFGNTGSARGTTLEGKMRETAMNMFRNVAV